jgi:hypothetical protein
MGLERDCTASWSGRRHDGRLLLETDEIIFRGDQRLVIRLRDVKSATVDEGTLVITHAGGSASFEVGAKAGDWAHRILNPKGRAQKLGFKPGLRVRVDAIADASFVGELRGAGASVVRSGAAQSIFVGAEDAAALTAAAKHAHSIEGDACLWIVYPKGRKDITEAMVLEAGRRAGLKDVKVVRFSDTHTALKFVVPLARR